MHVHVWKGHAQRELFEDAPARKQEARGPPDPIPAEQKARGKKGRGLYLLT